MRNRERAGRDLRRAAVFMMAAVFVACVPARARAGADTIKLGVGTGGVGHLAIAQEKGYFAAENLTVEFVHFEAAEPIAVAVAAGSIDFGATGLSGALYTLGGQGLIKIIAGSIREVPGFQFLTVVVSNQAYAAGWTQLKDLAGHSVAVPQIGSPSHYSLALIAEKYRIDLTGVRVLPVQSVPNSISAATGGQADAAIIPIPSVMPALQRGDVKLMGFVGDEAPWQVQAVFTTGKIANERHELVERFLRAYRKGAKDLHDTFTGPDGRRQDGEAAEQIFAIIAKYTNQTPAQAKLAISYVDPEGRLDVKDVLHQIAWYKQQNMLKGAVEGDLVIDKRYVTALPER
jgi:NitT/TauT family transport system substrate-binding protein